MFTTLAHVLDKSALYGKGIAPARILLAKSLRLLPLHCVERAGVRPPPIGYCWRTLSVCSLSTAWRGLGQESSGGALQRPPPFGFASSIRKDGEPVIVCATSESSAIAHHWLQEQPLRLDHRAAGPLQSCRHLALLRRR